MSSITLDEILRLPPAERVEIAQQIWESIVEYRESLPLTVAEKAELERRRREYQKDPDAGEPWETFRASLSRE
jgi:putative addiction module component (TIGR02574 family)